MLKQWCESLYPPDRTLLDRLAELMTVNGGTTTIGKVVPTTTNRWGRSGLVLQEVLEMTALASCFTLLKQMFPAEVTWAHLKLKSLTEKAPGMIEVHTIEEMRLL